MSGFGTAVATDEYVEAFLGGDETEALVLGALVFIDRRG